MLWVSRAQAEHDAFAGVLRSRGVVVHYYSDLLAQTLFERAKHDPSFIVGANPAEAVQRSKEALKAA